MRRLLVLIVLMMMAVTLTVQAQDENVFLFSDLDADFTVQDLEFTFNYPSDWVWNADSGIIVAENESDILAENDDDDSTSIEGTIISLDAFPVDSFGLVDPTLDSLVDFLVDAIGLEVTEVVEVPVMTRRAITVIASDDDVAGVVTFWVQNDFLVFFSMRTANLAIDSNFGFTWGIILSTITPIIELELTETIELPDFDISVDYPEGWTPVITEDGIIIYEFEEDGSRFVTEGLRFSLTFIEAPFDTLGLPEDPNNADILDVLNQLLIVDEDITPLVTEEYVILTFEGISIVGTNENGENIQGALLVSTPDTRMMITAMAAGDMDTLVENDSLFMAMLKSIVVLD